MRKKSIAKFLIPAVLVVLALLAFLINRAMSSNMAEKNTNSVPNNDVKTQAYSAPAYPSFEENDKMFGRQDAVLKIFVYEDYSDQYSAVLADTLEKIRLESDDKLAIIVRPFISNLSPAGLFAASAVACAGEQDKWLEMRALLFAQSKNGLVMAENGAAYAKQIGLNESEFNRCLTNTEKSEKIEKLAVQAQTYGVQGAPTLFIGDELIIGARPYADFTDSNGDKIEGLKSVIARKISSIK